MATKQRNETWLLSTIAALLILFGLFYSFLFPQEALTFINQNLHIIIPVSSALVAIILLVYFVTRIKTNREKKLLSNRNKQIKLAEQLIWRGRFSLETQKAQILLDDTAEARDKWREVKQNYIRKKLYPVVSEKEVPINLASALIENTISNNKYRSGRLPTYGVSNIE